VRKHRTWELKAGAWQVEQVETALTGPPKKKKKKKRTRGILVLLTANASQPGAVASSWALGCHTVSDDTQSDFRESHFLLSEWDFQSRDAKNGGRQSAAVVERGAIALPGAVARSRSPRMIVQSL